MFEFVSDDGDYYVTEIDGDEVYLQVGTFKRLVSFHDLDLYGVYRDFQSTHSFPRNGNDAFLDHLRNMLIDPEYVDDIVWCDDCDEPEPNGDNMHTTDGGDGMVCESCLQNYIYCEYCSEYRNSDDSVWIESRGERVCEPCVDNYFMYCDNCEEYVDPDDHYHDDDCDCESPVQRFTIPNDGNDPLANDTALKVTLPAGLISAEGVEQVRRLIQRHGLKARDAAFSQGEIGWYDSRNPAHVAAQNEYVKWYDLSQAVETLDPKWQTKDGNYTKRLSRMAYKTFGVKIPPALLSEIGNIGNANSQGSDYEIEITRNLNLSAAEFGHEDSCYWQSYSSSRCTLKSNGSFGLRSFGERNGWDGGVKGRAWVQPLKSVNGELTPTFDAQGADAYVVFNGYGDLSGYAPARIVAHMVGMTYRKIEFSLGEAYINAGGYLIAPEDIATDYTDGRLNLYVDPHENLYNRELAEGRVMSNVA